MTGVEAGDSADQGPESSPGPPNPIAPYLTMLALAAIIGAVLAAYFWMNREEIIHILTQSPI